MLKVLVSALVITSAMFSSISHAQFADSVASYTAGAGVTSGYTSANSILGAPTTFIGYQNADPFNPPFLSSDIVGVGAGGSLTLHLSQPILNDPTHPFGLDFIIFGHAGFNITNGDYSGGGITDGTFFTGGTSVSRVSVSADGLNYFVLNPAFAANVDGLAPTDADGDPLRPVNPALTQADFAGKDLAGIRTLYNGSAGGMSYDLAWAQDGAGHSVSLPSASYVRVDVLTGVGYLDAVSVVPEPATAGLVAMGLIGWIGSKRRRRV